MAHYAILDEDDIVINVIAGVDETELIDGLDPETYYGNEFGKRCVRTSFNMSGNIHRMGKDPFRKNFAKIGYKYDEVGFFDPVKPFDSWTFNTETYLYDPPVEKPVTNQVIRNWNSEILDWEYILIPKVLDHEWDESDQKWKIIPSTDYDGNPTYIFFTRCDLPEDAPGPE